MTPAIIRSPILKSIDGGWSHALSMFLQHLLTGPLGFATVGVAVELDGGPVVYSCKIRGFADRRRGVVSSRFVLGWQSDNNIHALLVSFVVGLPP
jgi:hypothetical protein